MRFIHFAVCLAFVAPLCSAFVRVAPVTRTLAGSQSRIFSEDPEGGAESSSALVPVSTENVEASVGVAGAVAGLVLFGNPIVAVVLAALGNYATKQESEVGDAFRGVGTAILNSVNFAAKLNERYDVTDKVGTAAAGAYQNLKEKDTSDAKVLEKVEDIFTKAKSTVTDISSDIDLKSKVGEFVYAAGDISTQAIEKASDLNEKYKITDQAGAKVKEVVEKAKKEL